jgi:decaprenyl-phosphate phosphoribosyltransferase
MRMVPAPSGYTRPDLEPHAATHPFPEAAAEARRPSPPPPRPRRSLGRALIAAARPRQWLKNLLVLAAPAAAGVLTDVASLQAAGLAFVAFCLTASGGYFLNDLRDAPRDRRHPAKRHRPVAAREVGPGTALAAGALLVVAGLAVALAVNLELFAAVAGYAALTFAYTVHLKRLPIMDIATVAAFFVVRAIAGGLAAEIPLSPWFLIVASFGSLFIVAGKRASEYAQLGDARAVTRPALAHYSYGYLRNLRTMAASVTLTAYCLWAFDRARTLDGSPFMELSIIPFVLFIMRYAMLTEDDGEATPEDLVLGDPGLRAGAVAWMIVFGCGVYLGT